VWAYTSLVGALIRSNNFLFRTSVVSQKKKSSFSTSLAWLLHTFLLQPYQVKLVSVGKRLRKILKKNRLFFVQFNLVPPARRFRYGLRLFRMLLFFEAGIGLRERFNSLFFDPV
jgi:hypothetical protein